jgi:GNAT superfamily N-acetyltransferase
MAGLHCSNALELSLFPTGHDRAILAPVDQVRIRPLAVADREAAVAVINTAARWYREFLPPEELHDPEMTAAQWDEEARRLMWYGGFLGGVLVAVMGLEYSRDAALLRHAYILPEHQHRGLGLDLAEHLETEARREGAARGLRRIIVGTYARNYKARGALEKSGYRLSADSAAILRTYYAIPEDRLLASVTYEKPA